MRFLAVPQEPKRLEGAPTIPLEASTFGVSSELRSDRATHDTADGICFFLRHLPDKYEGLL